MQHEVDMSVSIRPTENNDDDFVDLGNLDFDKLRQAFQKSENKNTLVFDLQEAIEQKLQKMVQQNPLRLEFYERYKKIISDYNQGKDIHAVQKTFEELEEFIKSMSEEEARAFAEGLDEESLAIFDILRKPSLSKKEMDAVKKVAKETLDKLKAEKLTIERWRESTQITAQVRTMIFDQLQYLPQESYPDMEVQEKTDLVYQHIYSNYPGGGASVYAPY